MFVISSFPGQYINSEILAQKTYIHLSKNLGSLQSPSAIIVAPHPLHLREDSNTVAPVPSPTAGGGRRMTNRQKGRRTAETGIPRI